MPSVTFIVVNWNGEAYISACLDSIQSQTGTDFEIIVVDNCSSDNSVALIKDSFSGVTLVQLDRNHGFAGGNNRGYAYAKGEFIALVNNDAVLCPDWLRHMTAALRQVESLGCCASKVIIAGTDRIDSVGDHFTTAFSGTKEGEYEPAGNFTSRRIMHGVCAAAAIYRKSMLDEIGFFDEDFFLNHEDTDLNMRIWLAGWECLFIPEAAAYHQVNRSIGTMSDTSVYHFSRNTVWAWIKNTPTRFLFTHLPQRLLYELFAGILFCLIHGKWRPYCKGKFDALRGLPRMFRKRPTVRRCLSPEQITRDLQPITFYLVRRFGKLFRPSLRLRS
jgi:GT2 family glycosyltransferase